MLDSSFDAEIIACPQLPTTLPTLDELIGRDGITTENVAQHLLALISTPSDTGHVYTLHAELEGGKLMPVFEQLLTGWKDQGYELVSMRQSYSGLTEILPHQEIAMRSVEGRSGVLVTQT